ncbi:MAG TPA: bifunctional YncE family protein/alkaline phosphatase family protein [Acidobacteriaceae bacterium]|nr:bifunctional YncE family protein/alkaline phosphatase family protein [Acidobacteriaceae bacterium]
MHSPFKLFLPLALIPLCAAAQITLPNGRLITPAGVTTQLAPFPFALAVRPDGAQIVAPSIGWPFALNIIDDPASEQPRVHRIPAGTKNDPAVEVHTGVAYSLDGSLLYDATGDSGAVDIYSVKDFSRIARIPLGGPPGGAKYPSSFAASLVLSTDGHLLYVLDQGNWRVVVIDIATRSVLISAPTGVDPIALALSPNGRHLYVANSGLFEYKLIGGFDQDDPLGTGLHFPPTGYPSAAARNGTTAEGHDIPALGDENNPRGSSLFTYDLANPRAPRLVARLRLGEPVVERAGGVVGGAAPSGIAADDAHVYVSLAHDDAIAVISVDGSRLETQMPLTPFIGAEFSDSRGRPLRGIAPQGLALGPQRLYVAESGIDAVAVIDTATNRVLGHIPAGWYPAAVALSPDGRTLYTLNNKGRGAGPNYLNGRRVYIGELEHGSLSAVPVADVDRNLASLTDNVIANNEAALRTATPMPAVPIHHVFLIIRENRTFDEIFGDLPGVDGLAQIARYGLHGWAEENPSVRNLSVTPNAHALAASFATSDHFFVDSDVSADGHRWAVGIAPTPWMNIAWTTGYGGRRSGDPISPVPGRRAMFGGADAPMPEDEPEFGSLWEHVAGAGLPILNYGEGLELEGSDEADGTAPEGQRLYLNAPLPAPVFASTDRRYPTFNLGIPDQYRYAEFARDFPNRLARGPAPALTVIRLPDDHTTDPRPADGYPYRASYVADNDLALGKIVQLISHSPLWKDSAIFVIEDDAQSGADHVDAHRSPLLVISPWVRRGAVGHITTSMVGVQRAIYQLLGIGPLNLEDALSAGLGDLFTTTPEFTPYTALPSDPRVFDPRKARLAHPKTAEQARELLDCDDPEEIEQQFLQPTRPR